MTCMRSASLSRQQMAWTRIRDRSGRIRGSGRHSSHSFSAPASCTTTNRCFKASPPRFDSKSGFDEPGCSPSHSFSQADQPYTGRGTWQDSCLGLLRAKRGVKVRKRCGSTMQLGKSLQRVDSIS